jgi:hypothetical protein
VASTASLETLATIFTTYGRIYRNLTLIKRKAQPEKGLCGTALVSIIVDAKSKELVLSKLTGKQKVWFYPNAKTKLIIRLSKVGAMIRQMLNG